MPELRERKGLCAARLRRLRFRTSHNPRWPSQSSEHYRVVSLLSDTVTPRGLPKFIALPTYPSTDTVGGNWCLSGYQSPQQSASRRFPTYVSTGLFRTFAFHNFPALLLQYAVQSSQGAAGPVGHPHTREQAGRLLSGVQMARFTALRKGQSPAASRRPPAAKSRQCDAASALSALNDGWKGTGHPHQPRCLRACNNDTIRRDRQIGQSMLPLRSDWLDMRACGWLLRFNGDTLREPMTPLELPTGDARCAPSLQKMCVCTTCAV